MVNCIIFSLLSFLSVIFSYPSVLSDFNPQIDTDFDYVYNKHYNIYVYKYIIRICLIIIFY